MPTVVVTGHRIRLRARRVKSNLCHQPEDHSYGMRSYFASYSSIQSLTDFPASCHILAEPVLGRYHLSQVRDTPVPLGPPFYIRATSEGLETN